MGITISGLDAVINRLDSLSRNLPKIAEQIAKELSEIGYQVAYGVLSGHVFDGETISSLTAEKEADNRYVLYANSQAILFLEFGAGARYAQAHPWAEETGMGAGTFSPKGHWDDPNGWWFETDDPRLIVRIDERTGQGYGHSYGMPPAMPFYRADKEMRKNITDVARRVFANAGH